MKVVICGAGYVGSNITKYLAHEDNDVTIVDVDPHLVRDITDQLDVQGIAGFASHPHVLEQAGLRDADLLIAVTQSDETNLVACKLGATMFNIPTKIARIRSADYLSHPEIFTPENFAVDLAICPEQVLTDYIAKLLEFPESLQVLEFAGGKVRVRAVVSDCIETLFGELVGEVPLPVLGTAEPVGDLAVVRQHHHVLDAVEPFLVIAREQHLFGRAHAAKIGQVVDEDRAVGANARRAVATSVVRAVAAKQRVVWIFGEAFGDLFERECAVGGAVARATRAAVTAERAFAEFEAALGGLGVFPSPGRARVLWVGLDDPSEGFTRLAAALYRTIVPEVHEVSSPTVAELAKLYENTFRNINIALANEFAMMCRKLSVSSKEVIDAAATKPFGFMPFYAGPGIGGHCIAVDPFYLSWKMRLNGYEPRFIHIADEINASMPGYVVEMVTVRVENRCDDRPANFVKEHKVGVH